MEAAIQDWKPAPVPPIEPTSRTNDHFDEPPEVRPQPPASVAENNEPAYEEPRVRPSWARELLDTSGDWRALARRGATGIGLASLYGVALGAREGGASMLIHAVGVPAALLAVAAVGLPALYILLALFDTPLSPRRAAGAAVVGMASSGLVLAGLAPLAALYVVTSSTVEAAAMAATFGLILGGLLGLRHLVATLAEELAKADSATRAMAVVAQLGFGVFAIVLGWRVWSALLPLVGGAS